MSDPADEERTAAALDTLVAVARRLDAAAHLDAAAGHELPADHDFLRAVAETATTVLESQAASIALFDPSTGRLTFVAAAGPAAGDVVGLEIDAASGIAGYAFSTGQPLAITDVTADPRFDRTIAEATGYVPGSILATPLIDADGTIGVLEALDRRGGPFTLRDLDIAGALAREATTIARAGRLGRDARVLLRSALTSLGRAGADRGDETSLDAGAIDALVSAATLAIPADADDPTWRLADRVARLRSVDPESIELVIEWLDVVIRRARVPGGASREPFG